MSALAGPAQAVIFLTRLPVPFAGRLGLDGQLGRAVPWFPLVGALVGAVLGGVRLLGDLALPAGPSTALALAAAVLFTGALHEDGLADTADGLGAGGTRERRLEIMRDSRIGAYGTLALIASFVFAWSVLASFDGTDCLLAAISGCALARWAMPLAGAIFPPARRDGVGNLLAVDPARLTAATVLAVAVAVACCGPARGLLATAAAVLVTLALGAFSTRAVGGLSGDTYGATGKLVELAVFAVLLASLPSTS